MQLIRANMHAGGDDDGQTETRLDRTRTTGGSANFVNHLFAEMDRSSSLSTMDDEGNRVLINPMWAGRLNP